MCRSGTARLTLTCSPTSTRSLLVLSALPAGCSLTEPDDVSFRSLASSSSGTALEAATVVRSTAEEAAVRDRLGLADPFSIDYSEETVLVVGTFGGCPDTRYRLSVLETGGGVRVEAEVTAPGGGDVMTFPFQAVAAHVPSLQTGDRPETAVTTRISGRVAQDCRIGL